MKLTVLGKSPAWTDAGGACSGYLVEAGDGPGARARDGRAFLLDCGNGVFGKLRARRDYRDIEAVVISGSLPPNMTPAQLASLMTDGEVAHGGLIDQSAREVLTEVGNIVLSACLSAFGNILDMAVTFSVPRIHIESLEAMLRTFTVESKEVRYAMIAATRFRLSQNEVSGYLIVIIGLTSLIRVAAALTDTLDPEGQ